MIVNVYAIKDKVANEIGPIFQAVNDLVATRAYRDLVKNVTTQDDFILLYIAQFDTERHEFFNSGEYEVNI